MSCVIQGCGKPQKLDKMDETVIPKEKRLTTEDIFVFGDGACIFAFFGYLTHYFPTHFFSERRKIQEFFRNIRKLNPDSLFFGIFG